jgi:cobalt-zinc-cadmium efflux system outer membrane protein
MLRSTLSWCAGILAAGLVAPPGARAEEPAPYPFGRDLPAFRAPAAPDAAEVELPPEPAGVLRLRDVLAAALLRNPELASDAYELRAREAALLQAGAFPNPTLSLEVEDFAGTGDFGGFDGAQTTLLLGQLVELGGKRAARIELAAAERDLAAWDYEARRIDVLANATVASVDVLAAQERHRLAEGALELARSLREVAGLRSRAGLASPAEEIRAGVEVDVAEVELEHTEHELETARQTLAAAWGGEKAGFERGEGALAELPVVPDDATLRERLESSPAVARWRTELAQRDALRARARSERVPDVALIAGPRRLSGPEETAFVVGVSVPLPLWDRRRGAMDVAAFRGARQAADARAARVRAATELTAARIALQASAEEANLLQTRVLPGIERAVGEMRRGYERGRFAQIEVIEAERSRLAASEQHLRALTEAHHGAIEIERLTGVPLEVRR